MMQEKLKKIAIVFMMVCLTFPHISYAGFWGEAWAVSAYERALDTFEKSLKAQLKITASRLLSDRIKVLLTGSSSSATFITDYNDFIYGSAQDQAQVYMNDFFSGLKDGASDSLIAVLEDVEDSIDTQLEGAAVNAEITLDNYVDGGIDSIFDQSKGGGYVAFNEALTNPYNNRYGTYLMARNLASSKVSQVVETAKVEAIAGQGYIGKKDSETNLIETPGKLIADLTSAVENLPMQIMAFADSIPEVVGTMAATMLTQTIQNGINKVTKPIDDGLRDVHNTVHDGYKDVKKQIYSGVKFSD